MGLRRGFPFFCVCAVFSLLAGACTPETTIATNKAADYSGHPKMLFVEMVFEPARGLDLFFDAFQTSFEAELSGCGVTTRFFSFRPSGSDPLRLDASADPQMLALRAAIASFRPDSFLAVRETNYHFQADSVTQIGYLVDLTDGASRKVVWKARGTLGRRLSTISGAGAGLASDIASRLLQDGILAACKVAAGPT